MFSVVVSLDTYNISFIALFSSLLPLRTHLTTTVQVLARFDVITSEDWASSVPRNEQWLILFRYSFVLSPIAITNYRR